MLPVLGAAATLLKSKGVREAIKKYGTKAVEEAKKQIAKRSSAIDKSAKSVNDKTLGTTKRSLSKASAEMRTANKGPSSRNQVKLNKNKHIGVQGSKVRSTAGGDLKEIKKAKPVPMMKKGGKVRGYGMARGGKACKMR